MPFLCLLRHAQIVNDNLQYAKVVVRMGVRTECKNCDFSDIIEEEDVSMYIWIYKVVFSRA